MIAPGAGTTGEGDPPGATRPCASIVLSMKDASTGGGEERREGRGPLHGPIRGGARAILSPTGEETTPRPLPHNDATF